MSDRTLRADGALAGLKVAVLIESDYFEPEISYYEQRFAEEGAQVDFLTRLWGQPRITFYGHEYRAPFEASGSVEDLSDDDLRSYAAIIVPSGMVSDRLRFTEDVDRPSPATELVRRAFAEPTVLKGIICHGMWLLSMVPELVRGRPVTCHNNLVGDVRNMGARYVDADVVVDGDLVTGRTGKHAHLFAHTLSEELTRRRAPAGVSA